MPLPFTFLCRFTRARGSPEHPAHSGCEVQRTTTIPAARFTHPPPIPPTFSPLHPSSSSSTFLSAPRAPPSPALPAPPTLLLQCLHLLQEEPLLRVALRLGLAKHYDPAVHAPHVVARLHKRLDAVLDLQVWAEGVGEGRRPVAGRRFRALPVATPDRSWEAWGQKLTEDTTHWLRLQHALPALGTVGTCSWAVADKDQPGACSYQVACHHATLPILSTQHQLHSQSASLVICNR